MAADKEEISKKDAFNVLKESKMRGAAFWKEAEKIISTNPAQEEPLLTTINNKFESIKYMLSIQEYFLFPEGLFEWFAKWIKLSKIAQRNFIIKKLNLSCLFRF